MSDDQKRTVVVTGGSRGIGRAISLGFAGPDTHIVFNYFSPVNPEQEAAAAAETEALVAEAGGSATSYSTDVASEEGVADFFRNVLEETGRVDVLINNAGITKDGLLMRLKAKAWDDVMNINLRGVFLCTKIAAKSMMRQRYGRIINLASVVGVTGNAGQANYAASKAGVIGLTKSAAKELASRNITVNAIAPGFIETDMTAVLPDSVREAMLGEIPLARAGTPEDVAAVAVFLASRGADYMTGQVLHVSGGMYI